jgi:hypothetical protein
MNRNPSPLPSRIAAVAGGLALALAAASVPAVAAAQSIDLPPRPQPAPKPPPPPPPAPAASGVHQPAASSPQQVEIQGTRSRVNASPAGQLAPRTGDFVIKSEGSIAIRARCLEGGTVWVSKRSLERAPGATMEERRDAALRQSCRNVDFTK